MSEPVSSRTLNEMVKYYRERETETYFLYGFGTKWKTLE